jgi:RNA-directed DNA polymerase
MQADKEYGCIKKWKDKKDHGKGYRIINPPSAKLKTIQRVLLDSLLYLLPTPDYMGGGKGSSIRETMKKHMHKSMLIHFDISGFFPSVKAFHVYKALRSRGFSKDVAEVITKLTTYHGHLPQGAPCSTQLAKLVVMTPAKHLLNYLKRFGNHVDLSFWVDDIVISGPETLEQLMRKNVVFDIFSRYGFELKKEKTKIMDKNSEQEALGVRVDQHRMRPSNTISERISQIICDYGADSPQYKGMRRYIKYVTIN